MAQQRTWTMTAGEKNALGKSLAADLDSGVTLTGAPTISVHQKSGTTWTDVSADFTIANAQVNVAQFTAEDGEVVAIGEGVVFELTATTTPGSYDVRVSCAATDGTTPAATPPVRLEVLGPAA